MKSRHLNIWVSADEALFSMRRRREYADPELSLDAFQGRAYHLAVDLASRTDLAALAIVFAREDPNSGKMTYTAFVRCYINDAAVIEALNPSYPGWAADGYLAVTPGDFGTIEADILDLCMRFDVQSVAYDPWAATQLAQRLTLNTFRFSRSEPISRTSASKPRGWTQSCGQAALSTMATRCSSGPLAMSWDVMTCAPTCIQLRRFWQPIILASELGDLPRRLRILDEDLIVLRDKSGAIGLLEPFCPHRGTSLEFGLIAEKSIRCCYHGWLFDVDGRILETPGAPADSTLKDRLCHGAYPVHEHAGLVFAYLGPPDQKPVSPIFDTYDLPGYNLVARAPTFWHCNWLQVKENSMDPAHVAFLHTLPGRDGFSVLPAAQERVRRHRRLCRRSTCQPPGGAHQPRSAN